MISRTQHLAVWSSGVLVFGVCLGCGTSAERSERYADAMREQIQARQELAQLLAAIKTPADMAEATQELRERVDAMDQLARRSRSLGKPSAEVLGKLEEQFGTQAKAVTRRLIEETQRIEKLPGGSKWVKELSLLQ